MLPTTTATAVTLPGIVAGETEPGPSCTGCISFRGIAPNAKLIDLRVLDANGSATDSDVIAAIERAIEKKKRYNIRVINLSLGRPVFESFTEDPLCQAVEAAWNEGIVVVVAAGNLGRDNSFDNEGYGTITSPGNDPYAITVGAMKTALTPSIGDDLIASYSSKGPTAIDHVVKPDLVAPGNRIVSLNGFGYFHSSYPGNTIPTAHYKLSGTSMAAPMVSGAVALLLQQEPDMTPDQVKARLMKTASKNFLTSSIATDPVTGGDFHELLRHFHSRRRLSRHQCSVGGQRSGSGRFRGLVSTSGLRRSHWRGDDRDRRLGCLGHLGGLGNERGRRRQLRDLGDLGRLGHECRLGHRFTRRQQCHLGHRLTLRQLGHLGHGGHGRGDECARPGRRVTSRVSAIEPQAAERRLQQM